MHESETPSIQTCTTRRRGSALTMLAVLFVLVLWSLIAIPGRVEREFLGQAKFGWPFVHLREVSHESPDDQNFAIGSFTAPLETNLRLVKVNEIFTRNGFWTNSKNWPTGRDGTYLEFQPIGSALNIALLLFLVWAVVRLSQRRRNRKHNRMQFSLRSFVFFTTVVSFVIFYCISEYTNHQKSIESRRPN